MFLMWKFSKIQNERLIRDAEAECDKINMFYQAPCQKGIYDRAALDRFFQASGVGEFLEHDCFSFDQSVILNRTVDKSKLKGLVDKDISNGQEPQKIAMYNQVDDQKPPPLDYHTEVRNIENYFFRYYTLLPKSLIER